MATHRGIDIGAQYGAEIVAAADGVVIMANSTDSWGSGWGYYVMIDHGRWVRYVVWPIAAGWRFLWVKQFKRARLSAMWAIPAILTARTCILKLI